MFYQIGFANADSRNKPRQRTLATRIEKTLLTQLHFQLSKLQFQRANPNRLNFRYDELVLAVWNVDVDSTGTYQFQAVFKFKTNVRKHVLPYGDVYLRRRVFQAEIRMT